MLLVKQRHRDQGLCASKAKCGGWRGNMSTISYFRDMMMVVLAFLEFVNLLDH